MCTPQSFQLKNTWSSGNPPVDPADTCPAIVAAQRDKQHVPRQSHADTNPTLTQNCDPPQEWLAAAQKLHFMSDSTILAWLEGCRSRLHSEVDFDISQLPTEQRQAVSDLEECSDELVVVLLDFARSEFIDELAATSNFHVHWCYVCEDYRGIKKCNDFTRHIVEHDMQYYCVPPNSVMPTQAGPRCKSCPVTNPNPCHLNAHPVHNCVGIRYTRKSNLINHLKDKHGMDHDSAKKIASKSGHTEKKFFACGFCVSCFNSPQQQALHVHNVHYKNSEHAESWDSNKVILGLLSQPGLDEQWRSLLAAKPHLHESLFQWDPTSVKDLQRRLELGQEMPSDLVAAAVKESNHAAEWGYDFGS